MTKRISKAALRRAIHNHLVLSGFSKSGNTYFFPGDINKQNVRNLHRPLREERFQKDRHFVEENAQKLIQYFASGGEVDPTAIDPELVEVSSGTTEADLFRLATRLWSVPVSQGFGRRIRFLVMDRQNSKLIGLFALGDPVFNLSARDKWIGWTSEDRKQRLIHVMDAYVVGALPPYSQLIAGKLVAALMGSTEVKKVYERKYLDQVSVISEVSKRARLVLLTTTSALGRSSLYNRLVIPEGLHAIRIGTTRGFGHFHLSGKLFSMMRKYLEEKGHPYASGHRFGMGPNWRLRVARVAMDEIGLNGNDILRHGIKREVYTMPLATNWKEVLLGLHKRVRPRVLPSSDIVKYCLNRWIIPRADRDKRFKKFKSDEIMHCLLNGTPPSGW